MTIGQRIKWVFVCWFGTNCKREFDPYRPCWNCGTILKKGPRGYFD